MRITAAASNAYSTGGPAKGIRHNVGESPGVGLQTGAGRVEFRNFRIQKLGLP